MRCTHHSDGKVMLTIHEKRWMVKERLTHFKTRRGEGRKKHSFIPKSYLGIIFGWDRRLRNLQAQSCHEPADHTVNRQNNELFALKTLDTSTCASNYTCNFNKKGQVCQILAVNVQ